MKQIALGIALAFAPAFVVAQSQPEAQTRPPERSTVLVEAATTPVTPVATAPTQTVPAPIAPVSIAPVPIAPVKPEPVNTFVTNLRPPARTGTIPRTRWQHKQGHEIWTRAALSALKNHGAPLVDLVPRDIANWCPAYPTASDAQRRAFWVGFMSALAKHESTYKARAVGGGGQWYGLLQILPATARWRKCSVGTGEALKSGAANLSCAIRIMAITVPRDGVIHGYSGKRGLGITADWGPMHSAPKRRDMAAWLKRQNYCKPLASTRPKLRPAVKPVVDAG